MKTSAASEKMTGFVECPSCGENSFHRFMHKVAFIYGDGADQVDLSAEVPVWSCESCDFGYEDEQAEIIRHETVCNYLGRLTPENLRAFRQGAGLTQQQFASLTQIGIASIKRWEAGNQIQSAFVDRVVRTLMDSRAFAALQVVASRNVEQVQRPKFRTVISAQSQSDATNFQLRNCTFNVHREAA